MLYKWDSDKGAPGRGSEKPQIFADITCERSQAGRKGGRMGGVSPTLKGLLDRKIMWSEWASEGGNGQRRPNTPKRSESDHSTEVEAEAGLQNGSEK